MLTPYGTRGIVLTALAALVLAAAGLVATRASLHTALLAEAQAALTGDATLTRAPIPTRSALTAARQSAAGARSAKSAEQPRPH
ncbi:hypothetical protein I551_5011 [Mycobacterium ulcerans str. Harvey]|uniref:Uncharacterized protein n=1 Tax=Mycobacterium ulcerans str. Harvey TaxID=1299332 RepID=A0ABP3AE46_MYCUL|nr:hypothetical protein I551_5011 [Mycobacterium ulcerans str. Harvey]